ncbi:hypothetical protein GGR58DRAFT_404343 [Xylaria digitata]|uniref:Hydrophobin n=1 Tax=Xylaria multiplex TaxID=323545 RepID=A0A7C8J3R9_9PEZI|nr:hypothetical protein GQX73_g300 [Xylaria multiplex]KAI0536131.1 hypothetical protein GGR58DRAFT_404343 [Xylaria digitata]
MRFSVAAVFTFALGALAAPTAQGPPGGGDVTVGVAGDTCGKDLELSCCNKVTQTGDSINEAQGILAGTLTGLLENGDVGIFDGCSKLSVAALIGVQDLLNPTCRQQVACCQHSGTNQEGLVNVGLPCVALDSVL